MMPETRNNTLWARKIVLPLLLIFITIPYLNSLNCSWHLDDIKNVLFNSPLHLKELSLSAVKNSFFAHPHAPGTLYRPVSCFTFALNWFWGQSDVRGYHNVNIFFHLITSFFLYKTILLLLKSPRLGDKYSDSAYFIAGFATILWAINPIQTQAVTYIVQRMASLATMFYIIGIWSYLKARLLQPTNNQAYMLFFSSLVAFILALGSKENAITFPAALILIEFLFFKGTIRADKKSGLLLIGFIIITLACGLLVIGPDDIRNLLNTYTDRGFTPGQRLLTEARIVPFYLSLLFYPSPLRLSIDHDVQLSTSLLSPLTTLPAFIFLVMLTILPFILRKRYPLSSFALLFFLLNHIIESTIIPLELLFEHRNYLPSLFLFVPVALAIHILLDRYKNNTMMYSVIIVFSAILLILLAFGTMDRNRTWATERSLWTDALAKAPNRARPYINLAYDYQYTGHLQKAFELNVLSLDKQSPTPWKDTLRAYNNMGNIMTRTGHYEKAISFYDKALEFSKKKSSVTYYADIVLNRSKAQWYAGQNSTAFIAMAELINNYPNNGRFLQFYGEMFITDNRVEEGIAILSEALANSNRKDKEYWMTLLDLSLGYSRMGNFEKSIFFINVATGYDSASILTNLCLLENSIRAHQPTRAGIALNNLLSRLSWPELTAILEESSPERLTLPLTYSLLRQYASDWLTAQEEP